MVLTRGVRPVFVFALPAALAVMFAVSASAEVKAVEVRAPDTRIDGAPASTVNRETAAFDFSSTAGRNARFGCSLDGGPFRRCESPRRYGGLDAGRHRFEVRATSAGGNVDRTPAARSWTVVEDSAPVVAIEGAPRIETYHEYRYFRFSSDVSGSRFYCALDEEPFAACASGDYRHVPYGTHTFRVYAVGHGGVRGETTVAEYESRDPNWD